MSTFPIVPCLWFDDQAETAANFYTKLFPEGRIQATSRYPETGAPNPSGKPPGSVLTVEFVLKGQRFTALNGGPVFTLNPSVSFFVHVDSAQEVNRIVAALADGGQTLMPLDAYPWSERYAWVKDRFGVSFQVLVGKQESGAMFAPCLMFSGPQQGRAEEAIQAYTRIFANSRTDYVARYAATEGPEGSIKHARFSLNGQPMIAMDSHLEHGFTFNEALSLQVMCKDQREVDYYWEALSEGGEKSQCGWLKDRFGVSWQVVPDAIVHWMTSADVAARTRAFAAVMQMQKLDLAAIEAAFKGA